MPLTLRQLLQDQQQADNVSTRSKDHAPPKLSDNSNSSSSLSLASKQSLPKENNQLLLPTTTAGEVSPASLAAVGSLVDSVRTIRAMTDEVIDARKRIDEAKEEAKELEELDLDLPVS
ncbi:hypothetical protein IWW48_003607 [Coemansia sp. RSA 1200]|nr:hypothetical protein IWW48_003607 [Coemansia sp. RSA 1200]